MKKILCYLFLLGSFELAFSQTNQYSQYSYGQLSLPSFSEMQNIAAQKYNQYNENQKYLYALKDWIRELSLQIDESQFYSRLQEEYNDLVKIENKDLAKATSYLRQTEDNVKEIINDYRNYLKRKQNEQDYGQNLLRQGLQLYESGNFTGSINNFSKYLENDKTNTDVLFLRALGKSNINDIQGAINDYDKIIELHSNYPMQYNSLATAYNNKAYCLLELNRNKEALIFAEKALELDKTKGFIWDTRGEIYYNLGYYSKSIQDMDTALSLQEISNSYFIRGSAYIQIGKKDKACKDYEKAIELGEIKAEEALKQHCR